MVFSIKTYGVILAVTSAIYGVYGETTPAPLNCSLEVPACSEPVESVTDFKKMCSKMKTAVECLNPLNEKCPGHQEDIKDAIDQFGPPSDECCAGTIKFDECRKDIKQFDLIFLASNENDCGKMRIANTCAKDNQPNCAPPLLYSKIRGDLMTMRFRVEECEEFAKRRCLTDFPACSAPIRAASNPSNKCGKMKSAVNCLNTLKSKCPDIATKIDTKVTEIGPPSDKCCESLAQVENGCKKDIKSFLDNFQAADEDQCSKMREALECTNGVEIQCEDDTLKNELEEEKALMQENIDECERYKRQVCSAQVPACASSLEDNSSQNLKCTSIIEESNCLEALKPKCPHMEQEISDLLTKLGKPPTAECCEIQNNIDDCQKEVLPFDDTFSAADKDHCTKTRAALKCLEGLGTPCLVDTFQGPIDAGVTKFKNRADECFAKENEKPPEPVVVYDCPSEFQKCNAIVDEKADPATKCRNMRTAVSCLESVKAKCQDLNDIDDAIKALGPPSESCCARMNRFNSQCVGSIKSFVDNFQANSSKCGVVGSAYACAAAFKPQCHMLIFKEEIEQNMNKLTQLFDNCDNLGFFDKLAVPRDSAVGRQPTALVVLLPLVFVVTQMFCV